MTTPRTPSRAPRLPAALALVTLVLTPQLAAAGDDFWTWREGAVRDAEAVSEVKVLGWDYVAKEIVDSGARSDGVYYVHEATHVVQNGGASDAATLAEAEDEELVGAYHFLLEISHFDPERRLLHARIEVENTTADDVADLDVVLALSANEVWSRQDVAVTTLGVSALAAGETRSFDVVGVVPVDIEPGSYRLGALATRP